MSENSDSVGLKDWLAGGTAGARLEGGYDDCAVPDIIPEPDVPRGAGKGDFEANMAISLDQARPPKRVRWVLGPEICVVQNMAVVPDSWPGRVIYDQKPAKNGEKKVVG